MRTTQEVLDRLCKESSVIKSRRMTSKEVATLIADYHKAVLSVLLDNGYVMISENLRIAIVRLKDRQYVLRGNSYTNHRKFKLKMTPYSEIYNKIEEYYTSLLL